jgi:hypothetical protein
MDDPNKRTAAVEAAFNEEGQRQEAEARAAAERDAAERAVTTAAIPAAARRLDAVFQAYGSRRPGSR